MPLRLRAWQAPTASYLSLVEYIVVLSHFPGKETKAHVVPLFVEYPPHSKTCQQPMEHVLILVNSGARAPTEPPSLVWLKHREGVGRVCISRGPCG